jgi:hypothetical protein
VLIWNDGSSHHRPVMYDFPADVHQDDSQQDGPSIRHILDLPRSKYQRHDSKRQRVSLLSSQGLQNPHNESVHLAHQDLHSRNIMVDNDIDSHILATNKQPKKQLNVDLSPCHICRRKPTSKYELDSFADCESCGERTCWICIRECLGEGLYHPAYENETRSEAGADLMVMESRISHCKTDVAEVHEVDRVGRDIKRSGGQLQVHRGRICSRCCVERGTEGEVWCLGCLRAEGDG